MLSPGIQKPKHRHADTEPSKTRGESPREPSPATQARSANEPLPRLRHEAVAIGSRQRNPAAEDVFRHAFASLRCCASLRPFYFHHGSAAATVECRCALLGRRSSARSGATRAPPGHCSERLPEGSGVEVIKRSGTRTSMRAISRATRRYECVPRLRGRPCERGLRGGNSMHMSNTGPCRKRHSRHTSLDPWRLQPRQRGHHAAMHQAAAAKPRLQPRGPAGRGFGSDGKLLLPLSHTSLWGGRLWRSNIG